MALPTSYQTGTASVATGSKIVTGANTFWKGRVSPGDLFGSHQGLGIRIVDVEDGQLTLAHDWPGRPQTASLYEIQLVPDSVRAQETTRLLLEKMQQGMFLEPDAFGSLAGRAQYNDEAEGFTYLRTDVNPFLLYVKTSDASGAWSAGANFVGPAGSSGANGSNGAGDAYDIQINALSKPAQSEEFDHLFARTVTFPTNFAASRATVSTAPTGAAAFAILKNGTQVGTITFANGSKNGTFSGASTTFVAGDKLTIRAPSPRNATLSGMLFVLAGAR